MKFRGWQALLAKVEVTTILKSLRRTRKSLLTVAICVSGCVISGCVESSFTLANGSKLPREVLLPPGLTRKDVSVTLNYYTVLRGSDAKFIWTDRKWKKLGEVKGHSRPYPNDETIDFNGITEELALVPCTRLQCYVQDGHAVALFYVIDKHREWNENLTGGLPMCPKNGKNKIDLSKIPEGRTCRFDSSDWAGVAGTHPINADLLTP